MNICATHSEVFPYIVSFAQIIPFTVAFILNTVLYFLIIRRLSNRDVTKGEEKGDQQKQADKVRNAVTRMLVTTGIVFFLCLAPFQFYNGYLLVVRFADGKQFFDPDKVAVLAYASRILDMINSSVNPIIYSATNPRYRQAFLSAFGCGSVGQKKREIKSTVTKSTSVSHGFEKKIIFPYFMFFFHLCSVLFFGGGGLFSRFLL